MEFLQRDEFHRRFPPLADSTTLPAIFRERDGVLTPLLNGTALRSMTNLAALIEFLRARSVE